MIKKHPFAFLLLGVAAAWIITLSLNYVAFSGWNERGQFGDMFGSLNVLFSGMAFAALVYTLLLQQQQLSKQDEQLKMQREELQLQREEMVASRSELAKQAKAQRSLCRATVAQVRVAAVNAAIESHKLRAETAMRRDAIQSIDSAADVLAQLASQLEDEFKEA